MSNSFWSYGLWPTRLLCLWDFWGKHTRVDCHFLLQGIFPTQGSPALAGRFFTTEAPENRDQWKSLSCVWLYYTVHGILQARILEWVAFPFSRGSPQPRNWTHVSHISGTFFTSLATRKAQEYCSRYSYLLNLQGIFLTQESNRGLLHCRQILYQLSSQGSLPFYEREHTTFRQLIVYKCDDKCGRIGLLET